MTSDFASFTARLREFISSPSQGFDQLALELFGLQFAHNVPYRRLCESRGVTPKTVEHWTQIPAVPTSAFKELELSCLPPTERTDVFHSSGTTEQRPSRHFHSAESLAIYEASLWPWFSAHLLPDFKSEISNLKLVILTPPPSQAPNSSLVHMFEVARQKLNAPKTAFVGKIAADDSWTLDFNATLAALNQKSEIRNQKLILGTAFSFVHLLDFMGGQNLHVALPTGSRVMETGGYKGRSRVLPKAELHALISERLGISQSQIICEYGMSELSSQAYDLEIRNLEFGIRNFRFSPWARAEIISPETGREVAEGETGLLRIFDLANVFSVMAIQTEDLAIRRGDGFELIGRATQAEPRGCSLMAI